ncbi:MAG: cation-translocating P-type ATPase [Promethearchaeota archaeon]
MNSYYKESIDDLVKKFNTDINKGLSTEEAKARLERYGPNILPDVSKGFIKIYLAPLFNWLIVIYLACSLVMFFASFFGKVNNFSMIIITLGIVGVNCFIAIFQQYRATKKLEALKKLSAPMAKIIRDGKKQEIPTENIVIGDILVLNQGDKIAADARIIEGANLEANEASLTGESEPVKKFNDGSPITVEGELPISERKNMVFYGTFITMGSGKSIVVETGANTEIGKISVGLEQAGTSEIPIRNKMNNFGKWLGLVIVALWMVTLILKLITTGKLPIVGSLNAALDLMPINLPLLVTIILLTGVLAMAHHGVIVRNIASVDSLGRVSVVCSDKTGTLTKNQMSVQHVWTNGYVFKVTGSGYSPEGKIIKIDNKKNPEYVTHVENYPQLKLLLISGFLNNNSALVKNTIKAANRNIDTWDVIGSPTEGALMVLFQKGMGDYLLEDFEHVKEYPFSSALKRMTKIFRNQEKFFSFTKGASEILIPRCSKILYKDTSIEFTETLKNEVMQKINEYAGKGYRVLSFCYKEFYMLPSDIDELRDQFESDMIYLGFVTILDPPREGVKESVVQCHEAGIDVIMITGDSPATAKSIAQQISIINSEVELVVEGKDIDQAIEMPNFDKIKVFARVSPEHKEKIIKKYKTENKVVAMTGDGVNDALALNLADAGMAMGITGTDVAKEAADMVISDDSFNSIVKGIHQGRGIFTKVRAVVFFYICINVFEGLVAFILAVILGYPWWQDPASPYYMQWIFLSITLHIFPGLILTFDTISDDVMKEKPRDEEEILSKKTILLMCIYGGLLALAMIITYFIALTGSYPVFPSNHELGVWNDAYLYTPTTLHLTPTVKLNEAKALTMLMVTLYFCESFLVLQIRRPNKSLIASIREDSNKFMYFLLGILFIAFISIMYIPGFQIGLATITGLNFMFMYLTALDWLVCFLISLICIVSFEGIKYYLRMKNIVL